MKTALLLSTAFLIFVHVLAGFAATPSFQGLGDLPGNAFYSKAYGVSSDGRVVVGASQSVAPNSYASKATEAFIWTASGGMVGLGDLPGRESASQARAASADGSVVVGFGKPNWAGYEAYRWTQSGGMAGLGDLPGSFDDSTALDVSSNGSVVVGVGQSSVGSQAFRWTKSGGMVGLGFLNPTASYVYSIAYAVSGNGSVIVGVDNSTGYKAFRWTEESGMTSLYNGPGTTMARGISDNGQVIVGDYFNGLTSVGFRWTAENGLISLGGIPGHTTTYSTAYASSADGSIIVGGTNDWFGPYSGDEAFIWDKIHGMRNLQDWLQNDFGLDLTGWTLRDAKGISADGRTIAGTGINPNGDTEGWVAIIPEPATVALLATGGLALLRRRK